MANLAQVLDECALSPSFTSDSLVKRTSVRMRACTHTHTHKSLKENKKD